MFISVLEYLVESQFVIESAWRTLRRSGLLLVNVPTWIGKRFLELSAFRFGFSSKVEIEDHKMYYDKRALWPMLIRAGVQAESDPTALPQVRLKSLCSCQEGRLA